MARKTVTNVTTTTVKSNGNGEYLGTNISNTKSVTRSGPTAATSISRIFFGLLSAAFFIIVLCFIFRGRAPTFSSLLDMLSNVPTVNFDFSFASVPLGDWGIFNGLRDFVAGFMSILDFVGLLVSNLVYFLQFVFYFLRWIFFG